MIERMSARHVKPTCDPNTNRKPFAMDENLCNRVKFRMYSYEITEGHLS